MRRIRDMIDWYNANRDELKSNFALYQGAGGSISWDEWLEKEFRDYCEGFDEARMEEERENDE